MVKFNKGYSPEKNMDFHNKIFLAPMADVTNKDFRLLCRKNGADVVCTELISADAIVRNNERTKRLIKHYADEKPIGIQLFGANPKNILKAAEIVKDDFDFIDFNLGCPSNKILEQGAGAALLKRKNKVEEILRGLVKVGKPVTIKIRAGFDERYLNFLEIGKLAEKCGVSAITLHARTVKQGYSGKANWKWIKELKECVNIPVIGNGDIVDGESAKRMLSETGCDSVMVGRAAMGNPFIFREIKYFLENGKEMEKAGMKERLEAFLPIGGNMDFKSAKQHALWFTTGINGGNAMRLEISMMKRYDEIEKYFKRIIKISQKDYKDS